MPPPTPENLKRMRFNEDSPASEPGTVRATRSVTMEEVADEEDPDMSSGTRAVTTQDAPDEDDPMEGFAPGNDADYFIEEDSEGRFFGGGLTSEQKDILSIFEKSEGTEGVQDDVREAYGQQVDILLIQLIAGRAKYHCRTAYSPSL